MRISDRKRTTAGDKTICLPLPAGLDYERWIEDSAGYRQYLDEQIAQHPELIPPEITEEYFHGTKELMQQGFRAMAMLRNFHPYGRKTQALEPHSQSPFEHLNGFRYHDPWLRNLLIASSLNSRHVGKPVLHKSMEN